MAAQNWGNFIEVDGLNTGRFLDPPEFKVFHDKGNEENVFDRVDRTLSDKDSVHLDLNYSRSWFQTPNTYDNLNVQNVISKWSYGHSGVWQCGECGSAVADWDVQHCADLHARDQRSNGLQLWAVCATRCV